MNPTTSHAAALLAELGVPASAFTHGTLRARSPIDGATLGQVHLTSPAAAQAAIGRAQAAFGRWREVPAPRRGELVRLFGEELRRHKSALGNGPKYSEPSLMILRVRKTRGNSSAVMRIEG